MPCIHQHSQKSQRFINSLAIAQSAILVQRMSFAHPLPFTDCLPRKWPVQSLSFDVLILSYYDHRLSFDVQKTSFYNHRLSFDVQNLSFYRHRLSFWRGLAPLVAHDITCYNVLYQTLIDAHYSFVARQQSRFSVVFHPFRGIEFIGATFGRKRTRD